MINVDLLWYDIVLWFNLHLQSKTEKEIGDWSKLSKPRATVLAGIRRWHQKEAETRESHSGPINSGTNLIVPPIPSEL